MDGHAADDRIVNLDTTRIGRDEADDHIKACGFSCTVWAQ
jgi:hypothetical protein